MTKTMRRRVAIAVAGALVGGASAVSRADSGNALVESKTESEVVLGDRTYRVDEATVIESKDGTRLRLVEVPTIADGASADDAAVWFEASDAEATPIAYRLKLTGAQPR